MSTLPSDLNTTLLIEPFLSRPLRVQQPNFDYTTGVAFSNRIGNNPSNNDTGVLDTSKKFLNSFFNPKSQSTDGRLRDVNNRGDKELFSFNAFTNNRQYSNGEQEELGFGTVAGVGFIAILSIAGIYLIPR